MHGICVHTHIHVKYRCTVSHNCFYYTSKSEGWQLDIHIWHACVICGILVHLSPFEHLSTCGTLVTIKHSTAGWYHFPNNSTFWRWGDVSKFSICAWMWHFMDMRDTFDCTFHEHAEIAHLCLSVLTSTWSKLGYHLCMMLSRFMYFHTQCGTLKSSEMAHFGCKCDTQEYDDFCLTHQHVVA